MLMTIARPIPVIIVFLCFATVNGAQNSETSVKEFEVASVKKSVSARGGVIYHLPAGKFKAEGLTLLNLIDFAYDIADDQIQGLPSWGSRDRFDVEAIGEGPVESNPAKMETPAKKAMVRQLLADRFALVVQVQERTVPTYSLVEAPRGNKLERNSEKPYLIHAGRRSYVFQKATMAALAKQLSAGVRRDVGRAVADKTGITGEFDFNLTWGPNTAMNAAPSDSEAPVVSAGGELPSIFDALQEQLGLQLRSDHALMPFVVVTRAEPPTAN
jgi:uncharacterized protein (TIGR03435 family)